MKLKLLQTGYENFTGNISGIDFKDGTSVDSVSRQRAATVTLVIHGTLVEEVAAPAPEQPEGE